MKRFRILFLAIFSLLVISLFMGNVSAAPTYKLYEDSDGVRWQYAYISEEPERVEIAFFDNRNNQESVTIPSLSDLRSSDSDIPSSVKNLYVVKWVEKNLGTKASQSVTITSINFANATVINGVSPMIDNNEVTTITFSASAGTIIGNEAFTGYNLTINNLDKVASIGDKAFKNATLTHVNLALNSLETIGDSAFMGTNIEKVTSINTEKIEFNAFRDCLNLTSVKLGNNVKEIAAAAFQNAQKLTEINYNNVTKVGNFAFADCLAYNVDINNTKLTEIGDAAYSNTPSFKRALVIPDGVTALGWRAFYKSGITSVDLNNVEYLNASKKKEVYSPKGKEDGEGEAFADCENLSSVDFGKVWVVPFATFINNKKLTKVDLPDSVKWVSTMAFADCNISELNLNKVERIDTAAFANNQLTELYLPKSINVLNSSGMFINNNITKVTVAYDTMSSGITNFIFRTLFEGGGSSYGTPRYSFQGSSSSLITDLILEAPYKKGEEAVISSSFGSNQIRYINQSYNENSSDEGNVVNSNHYKNIIRPNYFYLLEGLKNITIGEGYEFIGEQAFLPYDGGSIKTKIEKVSLPISLKGIGSKAFEYSLINDANITLPEGLEFIGYQAFFGCSGFTKDFDSGNIKYIGSRAFQDSGVSNIYLRDKLEYIGNQPFYCSGYNNFCKNKNTKEIVFDLDIYSILGNQDANFLVHWSNQSTIDANGIQYDLIKFTDKVKAEPGGNFNNNIQNYFMSGIRAKEVDMGDAGWTTLAMYMFAGANIEKLTLPKNLETISPWALNGAKIGNVLEIPESVKNIGQNAFNASFSGKDNSIQIANLPSSLESIGEAAFWNAKFMQEDIVIPETVNHIGRSAFGTSIFKNESGFNRVTINANLPSSVVLEHNYYGDYYSSLSEVFLGYKIKKFSFGEKVTELPSNDIEKLGEKLDFYGIDGLEEVEFANLKVLPRKAFIDKTTLKKVTFNDGLEEVGDFAFYNTNVSELNLPDKNSTIKVGFSAFRRSGLETIGDDNSSFNILENNIVTTGPYVFADNANLTDLIIPDGFNNNSIDEYTFKNCYNLENVDIYKNVEVIKSEAFNGDYNFKKLFLWGDTKIEQNNVDEVSEAGKILILNTSGYYREALEENPDAELKFTIKKSSGNVDLTKEQIDNGYIYNYDGTGSITFDHPEEVTVNLVKTSDGYIANIQDVKEIKDYADFTIPASTDLYSYSNYDARQWDLEMEENRRSEELGTDAQFYALDEVLYLTSNHPKTKLTDNDKDFDKKNLIVYALRRDGVIMESNKWGEYTSHYARKDSKIKFEKYDSDTEEDAKMVYDIPFPAEEADISTENFKDMAFEIVKSEGVLPKKEIKLYYTNSMIDTIVDTDFDLSAGTIPDKVVEIVDKVIETVNTGSGRVISTIIFLILSFFVLRFIIIKKRKNKLVKI